MTNIPRTKVSGKPLVDIVIFTHNRLDMTKKCLDSLFRNTTLPFALTVIDDMSTDGTREHLSDLEAEYRSQCSRGGEGRGSLFSIKILLRKEKLQGGAQQLNTGLRETSLPLVVFMNNDIVVLPGWLEPLLKVIEDQKVGIVGLKLLYYDNTIQHAGMTFKYTATGEHIGRGEPQDRYPDIYETEAVTGACCLVRREAIMPGYDEETYCDWTGFEDVDICFRLRKKGWKVMYCGKSEAYHPEGSTIARDKAFWPPFIKTARKFINRWGTELQWASSV